MISAPSTCCTRPPGPPPNAATPCSRPPSRRCGGSASAPGASAPSSPPPLSSSITSTAGRHDHRPGPAVTANGSVPGDHRGVPGQQPVHTEVFSTDWSLGGGEYDCCRGDCTDSLGAEPDSVEGLPSGLEQGNTSFAWGS